MLSAREIRQLSPEDKEKFHQEAEARVKPFQFRTPEGTRPKEIVSLSKSDLQKIVGVLPALTSPTVSQLSDAEWVALNTILDEALVREVIPKLKAAGATGIVEYPLSKVVL